MNLIHKDLLTKQRTRIVVMAPGSSLTYQQVANIDTARIFTIAIGDAGRVMYPKADVLYHCDAKWWNYYKGCPEFDGSLKVSLEKTEYDNILQMRRSPIREGLDLNFPYIVTGNNSGYQALNLAMYCNPKEIILVGYDMKDRDGRHNVIGHHPKEVKRPYDFTLFKQKITELASTLDYLGVTVYNCTLDSDLECFPKRKLEDVL